jgi:hypothetical protein
MEGIKVEVDTREATMVDTKIEEDPRNIDMFILKTASIQTTH